MRIVRHWRHTPTETRGAVVAVGNFDGVHLGHRAVIERARALARAEGAPLAVLTFEPHPRQVLASPAEPFRLTPFRQKAEALAALDVETLFVAHFDRAFAAHTPEGFVNDVLAGGLGVKHVVVGYDFAFGRGRGGDVASLRALGVAAGFQTTQIAAAGDDEHVFSASEARKLLAEGVVAALPAILGRYWEVGGRVAGGDRRGRTIGFATANLKVSHLLHPTRGVYALWAGLDDDGGTAWHPAVANLGRRPTFDKTEDLLEVHILGFAGDIYGHRLRAVFVERVREERKFDGIEALKAQIARDCEAARAILAIAARPDAAPGGAMEPARRASS